MEKHTTARDHVEKADVEHQEYFQDDSNILNDVSREEAMHHAVLSEEELLVEKKLVRKIDLLIMPLVILVYLMNYIDR